MPEVKAKLSAKAATGGTASGTKKPAAKAKSAAKAASVKSSSAKPASAKPASAKPTVPKKPTATKAAAAKTAAKPASKAPARMPAKSDARITPDQRYRMICDAAYFRAERRGFVGGDPHEDWIAAEAEVDAMINSPRPS